jgi:hypothetical protein
LPNLLQAESVFTHVHMRVPGTAESAEWHSTFFDRSTKPGGPGPNIVYDNGHIGTMPNEGLAPPSEGGVIAFIEDPWGVRMELLEDPEYLGINHIHMMSADSERHPL